MPPDKWFSKDFHRRHSADKKMDHLASFFDALTFTHKKDDKSDKKPIPPSLDEQPTPPPKHWLNSGQQPFVGGFHPAFDPDETSSRPPFPGPSVNDGRRIVSSPGSPGSMMPVPQMSATMQYALSPPESSHSPGRLAPFISTEPPLSSRPVSASAVQLGAVNHVARTPRRASSTPPSPRSPSSSSNTIQCSGHTHAGKRCTRLVKLGPPLVGHHPELALDVERYCHQHRTKVLEPTGFYSLSGMFLEFDSKFDLEIDSKICEIMHPNA